MAKIPDQPQRRTIKLHYMMRFCDDYILLSFSWQCILGLNDWTFIYPESTSHKSLEKELRLMFPYWNINTYPSKNSWLTYRNTLGASSLVPSNISFSLWITMSFLGPLPEIWARLGDNNIESFRGKRTSSGYCRGRGWTFLDRRGSGPCLFLLAEEKENGAENYCNIFSYQINQEIDSHFRSRNKLDRNVTCSTIFWQQSDIFQPARHNDEWHCKPNNNSF